MGRPMSMKALAVAIALAVLAVGCDADGDAGVPEPDGSPSRSLRTSPDARVVIPDFVGTRAWGAREEAQALGLRPKVFSGLGSACLPRRGVMEQRPAPGTRVATGSRVVLVVNGRGVGDCGLGLPPAAADLRRIGGLFVDFARGTEPAHEGPPADTPVELFIGGVLARVIPTARMADRHEWRACPGGIGYAARSCPVSPLTPFREYPGPIAMTTEPPAHVCAHPTALPESLDVYRSVTLTPDEGRDCTSYFGVQLFVNDVGQIVAVSLVLSDP